MHSDDAAVLHGLEERLLAAGLPTRVIPPTDDTPFHSLVVRLAPLGPDEGTVDLQLSWLPLPEAVAASGARVLQAFVELTTALAPGAAAELSELVSRLDLVLPLGAFGVGGGGRFLYFKHNALYLEGPSVADEVQHLDRAVGFYYFELNLFLAPLLAVARGELGAAQALARPPFDALVPRS